MKKESKIKIVLSTILVTLLAILAVLLTTLFIDQTQASEEKEVLFNYSFTKAVCTDDNFCQDNVVYCKNSAFVAMKPLVDATAQFSRNWKDPRTEDEINRLCD